MSELSPAFIKWRYAAIIVFNKLMKFLSRIVPRKQMTVVIEQGTLKGLYYRSKISNKPYVSFLGIPYAKPPINNLRFKAPVKHPGWSGVLKAFSEGNMCFQYDALMTKKIVGSEDCLYLNVFVPQEELNDKKAVMVFIHGGAFNFGSASTDLYSPDYLIDENVIVVTINYRLNVLGFLNFDIDECPGNMGLKDQLFAIKWVKNNISAFGGDAENITIFGESAGSASVHCHTLSPQCKGLFQKAIMQSGCVFSPWAINKNHKQSALKLAKKLGCQKDDPKEIVQYLLNVPATDLVECAKLKNKQGETEVLIHEFVISIESDAVSDKYFPCRPDILAKMASPIPVITGLNSMEGMIAFGGHRLENTNNFDKAKEIGEYLEHNYNQETIDKIKKFYFKENDHEKTRLENICHLISDVFLVKDFHRGFDHLLGKNITPVYNYEFKFDGEINAFKKLLFATKPEFLSLNGACHGDELSYMFYGQLLGFAPKPNSPEFRMCKTISKLWSNFAKTGNPNSSELSFVWRNTSADEPKYLSLDGDNTHMVDGLLYGTRVNFWEDIHEVV